MTEPLARLSEVRTTNFCIHPYFGYVCPPNARLDLSATVPSVFGHGAIAEIDRDGFRNSGLPAHKPENELWVGIFGGSVAFSFAASDNAHTISGQLERKLNRSTRGIGNKAIRVLNLALPAGQQPQQLLVFLLRHFELDGIITFDGVNEIIVPGWFNRNQAPGFFPHLPIYHPLYGRTISDEQITLAADLQRRECSFTGHPRWLQSLLRSSFEREQLHIKHRLNELARPVAPFRSIFLDSETESLQAALESGVENWSRSTHFMHQLTRMLGIPALFALQPVPDRGKRLTELERASLAEQAELVDVRIAGFPMIRARAEQLRREGLPIEDFGDVFDQCEQTIYTDVIHFEDVGCELVAEELATSLLKQWPLFEKRAASDAYQSG